MGGGHVYSTDKTTFKIEPIMLDLMLQFFSNASYNFP